MHTTLPRPKTQTRQVSSPSSLGGHSFVPCESPSSDCAVCGAACTNDELLSALVCAGCELVVHETCRAKMRGSLCDKPRTNSFSDLNAAAAAALAGSKAQSPLRNEQGMMQVSSPKSVTKGQQVTFDEQTGKFHGISGMLQQEDDDLCLFFGCPLNSQPRLALPGYSDRIPAILVLLARELKRRKGMETEGIFRVPDDRDVLNLARDTLNCGAGMTRVGQSGPHTMSCLIKDWFRSLPEGGSCLGPMTVENLVFYGRPENAGDEENWEKLLFTDEILIEPNRSTFVWVLDLMGLVCEHESTNRMNERAIAIVFAPSIWEAPKSFSPMQAMNAVKDVSVVLYGAMMYNKKAGRRRDPFGGKE
ncbi:hypothetical protein BASA81_008328 [Batrachochytrium salamandrivorans]|nr:hypothetical protein BASA81_008328 [Batrachochytrium salamandrivorans]